MQVIKNLRSDRYAQIGLAALTLLFGLQTLRALLPLLVFVVRDRIGWDALQVGLLALVIFLSSFLAAGLRQLWGRKRSFQLVLGGLGLLRLAGQLWWGDSLIQLYLVIAATIFFLLALPIYWGHARARGPQATGLIAVGLMLGLVLDTAVHGFYETYDMLWRHDWGTAIIVFLLVLAQWWFLGRILTLPASAYSTANDTTFPLAFVLLAVGPFLFLQLIVFQNIARLAALTGWDQSAAFAWVLLTQILGLGTAVFFARFRHAKLWQAATLSGFVLAGSLLPGWPTGWLAAGLLFVGQIAAAALLTLALLGLGAGNGHAGLARITIAYGLSALLLVLFSFLFYGSYEIALPFPNTMLPPVAALVVGLAGYGGARQMGGLKTAVSPPRRLILVLLLLLLPLYRFYAAPAVTAVPGDSGPVRVMTYNLHNGFDPTGYLGADALVQAIANQQPDILALQEVSRGWAINGSFDLLAWLSQRLSMPYMYGPTADPLWGNAILSRFPIIDFELGSLPPDDLLLQRGFIWARLDVGQGQHLDVIATHFHHPENGNIVRLTQSQTILAHWAGNGRTLLMGDLNAEPGAPEIERLRQAGLVDALDVNGVRPGVTYPAPNPTQRLDYIWLTSDLTATNIRILPDLVSDHLGVVAAIGE